MGKKLVKLELAGFEELGSMLEPGRFPRRLRKAIRKATKRNALIAEGAIKTAISQGNFAPNSPVTAAIKGSAKPLVDSGALFKSIAGRDKSWDTAIVGVLRNTKRGGKGKSSGMVQIAAILHAGATIKVTDKMRRYFAYMSRKEPGKWFPLSEKTKMIVIPPRPFLEAATSSRRVEKYQDNWAGAVLEAITQIRQGGKV